ncbi:hypothetical protein AMTRI_Chr04g246850 [Amborella trichopoda]
MNTFIDFTMSGLFLSPQKAQQQQKSTYPSQPRLLAVGDLHGDLQKAKQALKIAKIFNENDHWIADNSMVVKLDVEKSNGKLLILQGNHESLNIQGDFRYVIKAGLDEFKNWGLEEQINIFNGVTKNYPSGIRARIAAFSPGGKFLSVF